MTLDAETTVQMMIAEFETIRESLGCDDEEDLTAQADFERQFSSIICSYKGHDIGPDQCNKPEHDLCYRCDRLRVELGIPDFREQ